VKGTGLTKRGRVRGSGNVARIIGLPMPLIVLMCEIAYFPDGGWSSWVAEHDHWAVLVTYPLGVYLLLRSLLWGVWIRDGRLIVRDWFWTRRISVTAITDVRTAPYSGMIYEGGESTILQVLSIHRVGKREPWDAQGTLSSRRSARRQVAAIRAELGLPELVQRTGGPAHRRELPRRR
jgi:hypothetical protein